MQPIFSTERFHIRHLHAATDEAGFLEMQTNPEVMQFTGNPKAQTPEEGRADLQRVIGYYTHPGNEFWVWAIADKASDEFLGTCAIVKNEMGEWDLGYRIRQSQWGRGIASEVFPALIRHCFENMQLPELVAYVFVNNKASVRVIEKAGLQFDKEFFNEDYQLLDRRYFIRQPQLV